MSKTITFSEKLKILPKKEPQSVHWSGVAIIVHSGIVRKDSKKEQHCYLSDDLIQGYSLGNLVLDEIKHNQKRGKYLEGHFLERKFDCDNIFTIPKKRRSTFFPKESLVLPSVQLELKKIHFELTNEELILIN